MVLCGGLFAAWTSIEYFEEDYFGSTSVLPDLHIISIGINDYSKNNEMNNLNGSVTDARKMVDLVLKDANKWKISKELENGGSTRSGMELLKFKKKYVLDSIYSYLLVDDQATEKNIRKTLKSIAADSKSNDLFVFYYAGISSSHEDEVKLYTYDDASLPIKDLSFLINQIAANRQLIISEAGDGKEFSNSLIFNLFEQNPILASNSDRNRVIITTKELGREKKINNNEYGGILTSYLINNDSLLYVFKSPLAFEMDLDRQEFYQPVSDQKYSAIYFENDYKDLLTLKNKENISRGSISKHVNNSKNDDSNLNKGNSKLHAILIGTNNYDESLGWDNLKNPQNDVNTIGRLLEKKYGAETTYIMDGTKNEVLMGMVNLKNQLDVDDKLIVFIAGHGYYQPDYSDGFLVFTDSYDLVEDPFLDSYLPMAKLNRLLDGIDSRQILTIFDVCYGASFELTNADLPIENYDKSDLDIKLKDFIEQKARYTSRIYLASGRYEVPDYWNNSLDHSPFASKLIKALEEENEFVSPGKIFSYLQGNATEPVLKKFGSHEERGDFLIPVIN
jgi:ABC-type uncharacterized transport system substrate-binding protein